jgi:hypothetical protein
MFSILIDVRDRRQAAPCDSAVSVATRHIDIDERTVQPALQRWWLVPVKCGTMKVYRVKLTSEERLQLAELLSKGKAAARTLTRARILLQADEGVAGPRLSDKAIAEALDVNRSTVERVRTRCVEEWFEACWRARGASAFASASRASPVTAWISIGDNPVESAESGSTIGSLSGCPAR